MTGHTPGPWEWKYGGLFSETADMHVLVVVGAGYGDEHIAGDPQDKALIAAVTDLLAACEAEEAIHQHRYACIPCREQDGYCSIAISLIEEANRLRCTAIAKAKGE